MTGHNDLTAHQGEAHQGEAHQGEAHPLEPQKVEGLVQQLASEGLLLLADVKLPSLVTRVAGEPVRGSWWGHPASTEIFALLRALEWHPDVWALKLVQEKLTFVHRRLWPALLGLVMARQRWQVQGLSRAEQGLWAAVEAHGQLELAQLPAGLGLSLKEGGAAARTLEGRLLAYVRLEHAGGGHSVQGLESWSVRSTRYGVSRLDSAVEALEQLEGCYRELEEQAGMRLRRPWR